MMLEFWLIATGLMVLALAFVIPPLLRKNLPLTEIDRNTINIAIYKERLAELTQENLTPEQYTQAQQELDKTLLQECQADRPLIQQSRAIWTAIVIAISIPALAVGSYWKLGAPQLLVAETPVTDPTHSKEGHLPANFDDMVNKLAARLQQQPDDAKGWYMLARSYSTLKRYQEAAQAYNQVLTRVGEKDPQLLTDFAEALALANEGKLTGQPTILLTAALELDPNHQQALWLAGFAAAQKQDYLAAIDYWQRFLKQLPADEVEARQALEKQIADARQLAQTQDEESSPSTTTTPAATLSSNSATATTATQIKVEVRLDPTLQAQVKPTDTVFIYARASQGPPMPLAIVKKSASELPTQVTLDDSMAMVPAMKLSNFQEITVLARISSSGLATPQPGDLQGQVSQVNVAKPNKVEIVINEIVPENN
ncbi:TPR repeat containing protein [Thioploca ingrica]|uniref:TPR repeat containing protein n=1 Tax=Thioploca ingrica TaxID=40754 RepID=A0A090AJD0_9GAMM|nr:TPR repeat containing protein [Thioploca ingrica]